MASMAKEVFELWPVTALDEVLLKGKALGH